MSSRHEYTNGEITVYWKPNVCIHSGNCVRNLEAVFRPAERPWVKIDGAPTPAIEDAVAKCPSGALTVEKNKE